MNRARALYSGAIITATPPRVAAGGEGPAPEPGSRRFDHSGEPTTSSRRRSRATILAPRGRRGRRGGAAFSRYGEATTYLSAARRRSVRHAIRPRPRAGRVEARVARGARPRDRVAVGSAVHRRARVVVHEVDRDSRRHRRDARARAGLRRAPRVARAFAVRGDRAGRRARRNPAAAWAIDRGEGREQAHGQRVAIGPGGPEARPVRGARADAVAAAGRGDRGAAREERRTCRVAQCQVRGPRIESARAEPAPSRRR